MARPRCLGHGNKGAEGIKRRSAGGRRKHENPGQLNLTPFDVWPGEAPGNAREVHLDLALLIVVPQYSQGSGSMPRKGKDIGQLRPFAHSIDGQDAAQKQAVNVDDRALLAGATPGTFRAFSTVYAPSRPGQAFKDIHEGPGGKIVPAEGPTKQTWINFGDARRAQHYVATYSQQHIQSDLRRNFSVAQQAATAARIKTDELSSLKDAVKTMEARKAPLAESTLFEAATERTRKKIASQRLSAWGDVGPVIRGFDVDAQTAKQTLSSAVIEKDKAATRSKVINVDQSKAANQLGVSDRAKQHLFRGARPGTLGSVVFHPKNVGDRFLATAGKVSSLSSFERQHNLKPTISVIASKPPRGGDRSPQATSVVPRRSKQPKGSRK